MTTEQQQLFTLDSGADMLIGPGDTAHVTVTPTCGKNIPHYIGWSPELLGKLVVRDVRAGIEPVAPARITASDLLTQLDQLSEVPTQIWLPLRRVLMEVGMDFTVVVENTTAEPMRFRCAAHGVLTQRLIAPAAPPGTLDEQVAALRANSERIQASLTDREREVLALRFPDTAAPKPPLGPEGIGGAAEKLWTEYATVRADEYVELAAKLQATVTEGGAALHAEQLQVEIQRSRELAFVDGFSMGVAFAAGAAATVRVGADDSGNNESYKGIGIVLNCSTFGPDFGKMILLIAQQHRIEPLHPEAMVPGGDWQGRCAVVLKVDGVGAFDATRIGNAALAAINKLPVEAP